MGARLPVLSGREIVQALRRGGWEEARQRGSHIIMWKAGSNATLSIPIIAKWRKARCAASSALPG